MRILAGAPEPSGEKLVAAARCDGAAGSLEKRNLTHDRHRHGFDCGVRRGLVVVAHPDDETVFFGGLIADHPEVDWDVDA